MYEAHAGIPNVARFYEQAQAFRQLLVTAAPDAEHASVADPGFVPSTPTAPVFHHSVLRPPV